MTQHKLRSVTERDDTHKSFRGFFTAVAVFEFQVEGTGQPKNPKNEIASGEDARTSERNSQGGGLKNPTNAERTPEPQNFKQTADGTQEPKETDSDQRRKNSEKIQTDSDQRRKNSEK